MAENKHTAWRFERKGCRVYSAQFHRGRPVKVADINVTHLDEGGLNYVGNLIAAAPDLLSGLIMEVKNCPLCKGDGVTDQTLEHLVELNGKRAGVKTDCPRCKPSRDIIARATQPGEV